MTIAEHNPPTVVDATRARRAVLALLFTCLLWGGSFTWAKRASGSINLAAHAADGSTLGSLLLLSHRFFFAGIAWFVLVPQARRGWSRSSVRRSLQLGLLFAAGMILQQTGLDRTTEATSAFLTSLTIVFVPLILALILRRPPALLIWPIILIAAIGVWLMTGASPAGFGTGELLGLSCSIVFSVYLLQMNHHVERDAPARLAGGQFIVIGLLCEIAGLIVHPHARHWPVQSLPFSPAILPDMLLLIVVATLLAFGLMTFFQPRVDPTRATLIYLVEPIFAAIFAYFAVGRTMSRSAILGAVLIVAANGLVEWVEFRKKQTTRDAENFV